MVIGNGIGIPFRRGGGVSSSDGAPSNLVLTVISDTEIDGTFTEGSTNQDGFYVYISTDNVTFTLKTTVLTGSFQATGLTADTLYYFKIQAYKGLTLSSFSNVAFNYTGVWYLGGSIASANCKAAYQPVGALNLANSYINLVNPGTNNAAPGTAPTFDTTKGWIFNGTSQYLTTGLVPANNQTWSMIIRFTEYTTGGDTLAGVYESASKTFYLQLYDTTNILNVGNGGTRGVNPAIPEGVIAVAGNKLYRNGVNTGITIAAGSGNITYDIWIGQVHYSSPANYFDGNIQALAIYDKVLSAAEVAAITKRINLLGGEDITLKQNYVNQGFGALVCFNMSTFFGADMSDPDILNTFAPTGLDIDNWLDACVNAGMKYAILTTKHWDGFALWPTAYACAGYEPYSIAQTTWYAANGSPDIVGLFVAGCVARGLKVGLYFNMNDTTWETRTGTTHATAAAAYLTMVQTQLSELLTNYGTIDTIWFDGWGWHVAYLNIPYLTIYKYIKAIQPNCVIVENSQIHPTYSSQIETYEVSANTVIPAGNVRCSEEIKSIRVNNEWFAFAASDQSSAAFTTAANIRLAINQANARNGTYTLGITPDSTGHLPAAQKTILESL